MELACSDMQELKGQDRKLFDKLVEKHHKQAYNVAFRMVGNHNDAEDLTQESFIRAFRFFGQYKQDMRFESWFYRIMLNVLLEKLRRKPKPTIWSLDAPIHGVDGDYHIEIADKKDGPEQTVLLREREAKMQNALKALPEVFRLAVIYADIEGLSYEEIAEATKTNVGTVRSRIFRGRRMLKQILNGMD